MNIDNILFQIGKLILILISILLLYRIFLRTKKRVCRYCTIQGTALLILAGILILSILNEKRIISFDFGLKLFEILFFAILLFSYYYLQRSFTFAEEELNHKTKTKQMKFKLKE